MWPEPEDDHVSPLRALLRSLGLERYLGLLVEVGYDDGALRDVAQWGPEELDDMVASLVAAGMKRPHALQLRRALGHSGGAWPVPVELAPAEQPAQLPTSVMARGGAAAAAPPREADALWRRWQAPVPGQPPPPGPHAGPHRLLRRTASLDVRLGGSQPAGTGPKGKVTFGLAWWRVPWTKGVHSLVPHRQTPPHGQAAGGTTIASKTPASAPGGRPGMPLPPGRRLTSEPAVRRSSEEVGLGWTGVRWAGLGLGSPCSLALACCRPMGAAKASCSRLC